MRSRNSWIFVILIAVSSQPVCLSEETAPPPAQPDPFNFEGPASGPKAEHWGLGVDSRIRISVEPIVRGPVVDRVTEPATIYVDAPKASQVDVYFEPVDAPYGGRPIGEAQLIGRSKDRLHRFPVKWATPEAHKYVKVYVVCTGQTTSRSKSIDLGLGGRLLKP